MRCLWRELWGANYLKGELVRLSSSVPQFFGTISGTLAYNGAKGGDYFLVTSTDPVEEVPLSRRYLLR